jgi:hypothetical protein
VTAKAQTHETLTKQQGELQSQLADVMQAITALDTADAEQKASATTAAATAAGSESYDALDLFLLNNAADAKEERRQVLIAQRGAVEADLRQVSALLKLVQPALPQLRTLASSTTTSADSSSSVGSSAASSGVSSKAQQLPAMAMSSVFAAPAAVPKRALEQSAVTGGTSGNADADTDSGSAQKKVKFAAEPEEQLADIDSSDMQTDSAAPAAAGASGRDFVPASRNSAAAAAKPAKKARVYTAAHKPAAAKAKAVPVTEDSSKVDTWTVPKGQTGDGKTSLNAKLGY